MSKTGMKYAYKVQAGDNVRFMAGDVRIMSIVLIDSGILKFSGVASSTEWGMESQAEVLGPLYVDGYTRVEIIERNFS